MLNNRLNITDSIISDLENNSINYNYSIRTLDSQIKRNRSILIQLEDTDSADETVATKKNKLRIGSSVSGILLHNGVNIATSFLPWSRSGIIYAHMYVNNLDVPRQSTQIFDRKNVAAIAFGEDDNVSPFPQIQGIPRPDEKTDLLYPYIFNVADTIYYSIQETDMNNIDVGLRSIQLYINGLKIPDTLVYYYTSNSTTVDLFFPFSYLEPLQERSEIFIEAIDFDSNESTSSISVNSQYRNVFLRNQSLANSQVSFSIRGSYDANDVVQLRANDIINNKILIFVNGKCINTESLIDNVIISGGNLNNILLELNELELNRILDIFKISRNSVDIEITILPGIKKVYSHLFENYNSSTLNFFVDDKIENGDDIFKRFENGGHSQVEYAFFANGCRVNETITMNVNEINNFNNFQQNGRLNFSSESDKVVEDFVSTSILFDGVFIDETDVDIKGPDNNVYNLVGPRYLPTFLNSSRFDMTQLLVGGDEDYPKNFFSVYDERNLEQYLSLTTNRLNTFRDNLQIEHINSNLYNYIETEENSGFNKKKSLYLIRQYLRGERFLENFVENSDDFYKFKTINILDTASGVTINSIGTTIDTNIDYNSDHSYQAIIYYGGRLVNNSFVSYININNKLNIRIQGNIQTPFNLVDRTENNFFQIEIWRTDVSQSDGVDFINIHGSILDSVGSPVEATNYNGEFVINLNTNIDSEIDGYLKKFHKFISIEDDVVVLRKVINTGVQGEPIYWIDPNNVETTGFFVEDKIFNSIERWRITKNIKEEFSLHLHSSLLPHLLAGNIYIGLKKKLRHIRGTLLTLSETQISPDDVGSTFNTISSPNNRFIVRLAQEAYGRTLRLTIDAPSNSSLTSISSYFNFTGNFDTTLTTEPAFPFLSSGELFVSACTEGDVYDTVLLDNIDYNYNLPSNVSDSGLKAAFSHIILFSQNLRYPDLEMGQTEQFIEIKTTPVHSEPVLYKRNLFIDLDVDQIGNPYNIIYCNQLSYGGKVYGISNTYRIEGLHIPFNKLYLKVYANGRRLLNSDYDIITDQLIRINSIHDKTIASTDQIYDISISTNFNIDFVINKENVIDSSELAHFFIIATQWYANVDNTAGVLFYNHLENYYNFIHYNFQFYGGELLGIERFNTDDLEDLSTSQVVEIIEDFLDIANEDNFPNRFTSPTLIERSDDNEDTLFPIIQEIIRFRPYVIAFLLWLISCNTKTFLDPHVDYNEYTTEGNTIEPSLNIDYDIYGRILDKLRFFARDEEEDILINPNTNTQYLPISMNDNNIFLNPLDLHKNPGDKLNLFLKRFKEYTVSNHILIDTANLDLPSSEMQYDSTQNYVVFSLLNYIRLDPDNALLNRCFQNTVYHEDLENGLIIDPNVNLEGLEENYLL